MHTLEYRTVAPPQLRTDNGPPRLYGTAIPYDSRSLKIGGEFYEYFQPGSVSASLRRLPVHLLWQHDWDQPLAFTGAKTLELYDLATGLDFQSVLDPQHSLHRDVLIAIGRGDVRGMSFQFKPDIDSWHMDGDDVVRIVHEATLYEISIVTQPAYVSTRVAIRAAPSPKLARRLRQYQRRANEILSLR